MNRKPSRRIRALLFIVLLFGSVPVWAANKPDNGKPASPPQQLGARIGVVDYLYLINQHPDTAQANAALRIEQEKAKQEYAAKAAGLNEPDRQALDIRMGQWLEQKRQELLAPIEAKVIAAVKAVAAEKGIGIVMPKTSVVCGGDDITAAVLSRLNGI